MVNTIAEQISDLFWRNAKTLILSVFTYAALC